MPDGQKQYPAKKKKFTKYILHGIAKFFGSFMPGCIIGTAAIAHTATDLVVKNEANKGSINMLIETVANLAKAGCTALGNFAKRASEKGNTINNPQYLHIHYCAKQVKVFVESVIDIVQSCLTIYAFFAPDGGNLHSNTTFLSTLFILLKQQSSKAIEAVEKFAIYIADYNGSNIDKIQNNQNQEGINYSLMILFFARETIECLPLIKYFSGILGLSKSYWPKILDYNGAKFVSYFISNIAFHLADGNKKIIKPISETFIYIVKNVLSYYIFEYKKNNFIKDENKKITGISSFVEKCGYNILLDSLSTIPGNVLFGNQISLISGLIIGSSTSIAECYSMYDQNEKKERKLMENLFAYSFDILSIGIIIKNINPDFSSKSKQLDFIKKIFSGIGLVVTTDYISRIFFKIVQNRIPEYNFNLNEYIDISELGKIINGNNNDIEMYGSVKKEENNLVEA